MLAELEARGPLLSRDLDDRSVRPWRSTEWSDRRNVSQMLEFLAARGEVAVVGRRGNQRVWDLVSRAMPAGVPPIDPDEARRTLARQRLRSMGIIRAERDHPHGVRVEVEGLPGEWIADPSGLERGFTGRTALLSPFDRLVYDRDRARQLFGFEYRLEMYVPEARRRWGYYVLSALRGDRLVAKVDARFDRPEAALRVPTIHLEAHTDDDLEAVTTELDGLARWLGASDVVIERTEAH